MLEFSPLRSEIIGCYGRPSALDRLAENSHHGMRVSPDEMLCLGESRRFAEIEAELRTLDPSGITIELSSGFTIWALSGDDRFEAFRRLSELALPEPPAFLQGLVGSVPAKVVVRDEDLLLIFSSVVSHHVRERLLAACADLLPVERRAPAEVPA